MKIVKLSELNGNNEALNLDVNAWLWGIKSTNLNYIVTRLKNQLIHLWKENVVRDGFGRYSTKSASDWEYVWSRRPVALTVVFDNGTAKCYNIKINDKDFE